MNLLRKTATTLGGIFFAVLLIAALAPKATRGIAAALVQVTNTPSNPVPDRDIDLPARHPVTLTSQSPSAGEIPFTSVDQTPFSVPVGKRLVVDSVSGFVLANSTDASVTIMLGCSIATGKSRGLSAFTVPIANTAGGVFVSSPKVYCDPGEPIFLNISGTPILSANYILIGHLVDCSSAPCDANPGSGVPTNTGTGPGDTNE